MYRTKPSLSEHETQQKMNSGRLGVDLPELQKYQKQFLQQTNPSQQSEMGSQYNRKFMIKEQRMQYNRRVRSKLDYDNSFSQNYSVDDSLRQRRKTNLSAYMFGGFVLQDYNEQVNKLHKLLLKKVILNR